MANKSDIHTYLKKRSDFLAEKFFLIEFCIEDGQRKFYFLRLYESVESCIGLFDTMT